MREEKKQISLDKYYAEKFENGHMKFDTQEGWDSFQAKKKSGWKRLTRFFIPVLFFVAASTWMVLDTSQTGGDSSSLSTIAQPQLPTMNRQGEKSSASFRVKEEDLLESAGNGKGNREENPPDLTAETMTDHSGLEKAKSPSIFSSKRSEEVTELKRDEVWVESYEADVPGKNRNIKTADRKEEMNVSETGNRRLSKSGAEAESMENVASRTKDQETKHEESAGYLAAEVDAKDKSTDAQDQDVVAGLEGNSALGLVINPGAQKKERGLMEEINSIGLPSWNLDLPMPELKQLGIRPHSPPKTSRWSLDLGLTFGREYQLTQDFKVEESSVKARLAHLAVRYDHLRRKSWRTFMYVSFDKIYGEREFVGNRIVRVYKDNNLSFGYGVGISLGSRFEIKTAFSLGISSIDKVEFEQKPTFVDGAFQYKDYTETKFDMLPTITYQNHTKVNFLLTERIDLYSGLVYRSPFEGRLRSDQVARENTLATFTDLQVLTGLRYHF